LIRLAIEKGEDLDFLYEYLDSDQKEIFDKLKEGN
jgi:hypothetical protein